MEVWLGNEDIRNRELDFLAEEQRKQRISSFGSFQIFYLLVMPEAIKSDIITSDISHHKLIR